MTHDDGISAPPPHAPSDVRMRGFARRAAVETVLQWLDQRVSPLPAESIGLECAAGRVLATPVVAECDVPGFARAMMDGFAVHTDDTCNASHSAPCRLQIVADILPGTPLAGTLCRGTTARIMTGAPMPVGANAVVPAEAAEVRGAVAAILRAVPPEKHVARPGEDVRRGETLLPANRHLRPQDLGLLSAVGAARLSVIRRPRVRIVLTGSELLPSGSTPTGHRIVDANGPMLQALVARDGGVVTRCQILPDAEKAILAAMREDADMVLVSGGSSVGIEDFAPRLLATHGQLVFHGIAIRPGSPTGIGVLQKRLVFLLPGNPVSCLCAYDFFAGRALRLLGGLPAAWPYHRTHLPLRSELGSQVGRVDYVRVQFREGMVEPVAVSGASALSSTTRADGFTVIPADVDQLSPRTRLPVYLYDGAREPSALASDLPRDYP